MIRTKPVKIRAKSRLVAVIASTADLLRAQRMRRLPDLFELRLDAFGPATAALRCAMPQLRAPYIITARHPAEGGVGKLTARQRRRLLREFLPTAAFVDVELRSRGQLQSILAAARDLNVGVIASVHDFCATPTAPRLAEFADAAEAIGADIFKLVTRTKNAADRERLLEFFASTKKRMPVSVMTVGPDARDLRLFFAREGSALIYTHLGTAQVEGQWSFRAMRRALGSQP